jgi:hypothetical protein
MRSRKRDRMLLSGGLTKLGPRGIGKHAQM